MAEHGTPLSVVVLISGGGTNLQAIIDGALADLPIDLRAVVSNEPDAYGLERARQAGIATRVLNHRDYPDRESYDAALAHLIDEYRPDLVVLAGFMRILTAGFVRHYSGRMFNIHPSLLPRHRGLNTHSRALEAGDTEHGATVHFVTEELDGGPLIVQARVPVMADDDAAALASRVLEKEHMIYPAAIRWFAEGRLRLGDQQVMLDGKPLSGPVDIDALSSTET